MNLEELSLLSKKELTRKEFLLYIGTVFIALIGINSILKTVTNPSDKTNTKPSFGFGPYGGKGN